MWNGINILGFAAGLGFFLLGMFMLEQGLRGLGSRSMKRVLLQQTRTPVRGVIVGTITTAVLQSSSLVGLIMLAFVGAGILELRNALGVIIGSNLGTTFTGWIVTFIGFKLDLGTFADPFLALGALGTVFFKADNKPFFYSNLVLGLGLLLMGLDEMSGGFSTLADNFDISIFHNHNLFIYFFGGVIFTAIIQSSSASMVIVLSALNAGVFTLSEAAPIIIGADLGTTSTVLLGALKGRLEKRRVALSHFFFNLVTDLLALLMFPLLLYFISHILNLKDPLYSVVMFHSLFNVIGIIIFIPFIDKFTQFLHFLVPEQHYKGESGSYIRSVPASVTDAATEAVNKELFSLIIQSIKLNLRCLKISPNHIFSGELDDYLGAHNLYEDDYALLKRIGGEILGYTYTVQSQTVNEDDIRELTQLNHAIRNVNYATKYMKDIRHNLAEFRHSETDLVYNFQLNFGLVYTDLVRKLIKLLVNKNPETLMENFKLFEVEVRKQYQDTLQKIYLESGENRIDDEQTSSLINANRAIYLSTKALLKAISILLGINEKF